MLIIGNNIIMVFFSTFYKLAEFSSSKTVSMHKKFSNKEEITLKI